MLGDLNDDIQSQNPHSEQFLELLKEFGLVDFQNHLDRSDGSDTGNVVSEEGHHIVVRNTGIKIHGRNNGQEEFYGALLPTG